MSKIKLTESQLYDIISEVTKKILKENYNNNLLLEYPYCPFPKDTPEYYEWLQKTFTPATKQYWRGKHPEWSEERCELEASKYDPYTLKKTKKQIEEDKEHSKLVKAMHDYSIGKLPSKKANKAIMDLASIGKKYKIYKKNMLPIMGTMSMNKK